MGIEAIQQGDEQLEDFRQSEKHNKLNYFHWLNSWNTALEAFTEQIKFCDEWQKKEETRTQLLAIRILLLWRKSNFFIGVAPLIIFNSQRKFRILFQSVFFGTKAIDALPLTTDLLKKR